MFNKLKNLSKMKKIKLFALAAFAMLSTNVFAQEISATKVFTFEAADKDAEECTITGFVADLDDEFKTATAIPEFVTHPSYKPGGEAKQYKVTAISANAFAGEPIQTITFTAPVEADDYFGINEIGAGAFAGTKIQTLDLTNTRITYVRNFFGTERAAVKTADKMNATLKKVILPATVKQLKNYAFWGCTKLESIDMTAATGLNVIGVAALAGCPLKALDLSKNKDLTQLVANVLNDDWDANVRFKAPTALVKVTLHEKFTALNGNLAGATKLTTVTGHILVKPNKTEVTAFTLGAGEFEGCTALTTIDTHKITDFNASCFQGCSSLNWIKVHFIDNNPYYSTFSWVDGVADEGIFETVCELLNKLNSENFELKQEQEVLHKTTLSDCVKYGKTLKREYENLKKEYEELEKENEMLENKLWNCKNMG